MVYCVYWNLRMRYCLLPHHWEWTVHSTSPTTLQVVITTENRIHRPAVNCNFWVGERPRKAELENHLHFSSLLQLFVFFGREFWLVIISNFIIIQCQIYQWWNSFGFSELIFVYLLCDFGIQNGSKSRTVDKNSEFPCQNFAE